MLVDINKGAETLLVPALNLIAAEKAAHIEKVVALSETEDPYAESSDLVNANISVIGIEKNYMNVSRFESFARAFPDGHFENIESYISSERMKKTRDEIDSVRKAVNSVEKLMEHGVKKFSAGFAGYHYNSSGRCQKVFLPAVDRADLF